jgi:thiamine-phosphate pyrophosphorylase
MIAEKSMMLLPDDAADSRILRIIDVNLNRLREALRVIEEYFRFLSCDVTVARALKGHRHSLERIEAGFGPAQLVASRDIGSDPFASVNSPEELTRTSPQEIMRAGFKRAQEAARVIEEYAKVSLRVEASGIAKALRFDLYSLEKELMDRRHE